jgi:hypothetical protein
MSANDLLQLQQPLKDGGIRLVNFFNGRLLTGKDLTREQAARLEAESRLGLAAGSGVAFGFDVELDTTLSKKDSPVLRISSGLAINRLGQTLRLASDTSVAITRSFDATGTSCVFAPCKPILAGTYVSGAGVYVLTVAPAEVSEGRAPTNGLDPANVACNTDATVEGLQFRLHTVKGELFADLDESQPGFRNALAYRFFGADIQEPWFAGLLDAKPRREGLAAAMRPKSLTDYDVPLALLYITGVAKLEYIDQWAVRRPLLQDTRSNWTSLVDAPRIALGQAMFLQFERHVQDITVPPADLGGATARTHFPFLPPVGVIPVVPETDKTDANATRFFGGLTYRGPAFINAARLEGLVRESLCYSPIDTAARVDPGENTARGEVVWLYRVRENKRAVDLGGTPRSYIVFASGHLPYRADAQFDLGRFDYGNYALARSI